VWVFEGDGAFQSSPAISTSMGSMFVASTEGTVYAINIGDGKLIWKYPCKHEFFIVKFLNRTVITFKINFRF
jgi:outer membrane protein assembly factor BamB